MRASVHGYTRAWKHTGTTGRLATTAARLPPAESPPTATNGRTSELGGVLVRPARRRWRRRRRRPGTGARAPGGSRRQHAEAAAVGERPAQVVVRLEVAEHPAAAVEPHQQARLSRRWPDGRSGRRHAAGVDVADLGDRSPGSGAASPGAARVPRPASAPRSAAGRARPSRPAARPSDGAASCRHSGIAGSRCVARTLQDRRRRRAARRRRRRTARGTCRCGRRANRRPPDRSSGRPRTPSSSRRSPGSGRPGASRPARSTPTPVIPANVAAEQRRPRSSTPACRARTPPTARRRPATVGDDERPALAGDRRRRAPTNHVETADAGADDAPRHDLEPAPDVGRRGRSARGTWP